jgi:YVTN family beta-propeller protein
VAIYRLAASGADREETVLVGDGGAAGGTGIAVNETTGHIFVANSAQNNVSVIDAVTKRVIATVGVGVDPGMVGVNPATNRVYVSNRGDDTVHVLVDTYVRRR